MLAFAVGFMAAAWVFLVAGQIYVSWRYNYTPWRIMRADIKGTLEKMAELNARMDNYEKMHAQNRVTSMSDEELADYELQIRNYRGSRANKR